MVSYDCELKISHLNSKSPKISPLHSPLNTITLSSPESSIQIGAALDVTLKLNGNFHFRQID